MILPKDPGLFVRACGRAREAVTGRWQIVPSHSTSLDWPYQTFNARWEKVARAPSFRDSWMRDRRCIVPVEWFSESNYETGQNLWWRFRRADGRAFGLAGLWNTWADRSVATLHETYALVTQNANGCPLMSRMHKADRRCPPALQDKRSVVVLEEDAWDTWLSGTKAEASALVRLAPVKIFIAGPESEASGFDAPLARESGNS